MIEEKRSVGDAWYAAPGDDDDVVLSTRVRLARNLANFPFPESCDDDEAVRVQNIVFDAFNHLPDDCIVIGICACFPLVDDLFDHIELFLVFSYEFVLAFLKFSSETVPFGK